jgi:hypothetical protein
MTLWQYSVSNKRCPWIRSKLAYLCAINLLLKVTDDIASCENDRRVVVRRIGLFKSLRK